MTKLIVDDAMSAKLNTVQDQVEICDRKGRTLGHFLPEVLYRQMRADIEISDEELDRRRREPARPLAEIWKSLGR